MTDAEVDQFLLREESDSAPEESTEVEIGGQEVTVTAELAEESLMNKILDDESDQEYVLRRVLAKYTTPSFPTVEEDGVELFDPDYVDDLVTARVDTLLKQFFILNGVDEDAIELAEEQQMEALKGNLETEMEMQTGGMNVDPEKLRQRVND